MAFNSLDLESATKKYDTLLIQYNQAQSDYLNYIKTNSNSDSPNKDLVVIEDAVTVAPIDKIINTAENTLEKCMALCSENPKCKSATFNPIDYVAPKCWLNTGEDEIISTINSNNYAIVTKEKELLQIIETLNIELTDTNNKILEIIKNNSKETLNYEDRYKQFNQLAQNLNKLKMERIKIKSKIKEFETLDEVHNYSNLIVTKNYYYYLVLIIVFLIILYFLYDIVISINIDSNDSFRIIFIVISLVLISLILLLFSNKK